MRVLIFVVAYNAETTLEGVLKRIPPQLAETYEVEVLIIDDASNDKTFERGEAVRRAAGLHFPLHVLSNPENQGYGGNQKIGFHYAIERGFDVVALIHGDGQYAPECLPFLLAPLADGEADVVLGSRMMVRGAARRGGMPLYKLVGNRILSAFQNRVLHASLSEFHSGYRLYSTQALVDIPFDLNTNDFHFDTEILIQLLRSERRILELPIPTYYGDEICYVNGVRYAKNVALSSLKARVQELDLFYDRKFDLSASSSEVGPYKTKLGYDSTHSYALETISPGVRVLELGCGDGRLAQRLRARGCFVAGVDTRPLPTGVDLDAFHLHDLNELPLPMEVSDFDVVLMLDVIEHLARPEEFVRELYRGSSSRPDLRLVISTGNIAFLPARLMLLAGQFNYGRRGILDMTHTRLFTFATFRRLLEGEGFEIETVRGVPAPFPEALGDSSALASLLLRANKRLIRLRRSLFAYQMFIVARPRPGLPYLLKAATDASAARAEAVETG